MSHVRIAETIIRQLGGAKIFAMAFQKGKAVAFGPSEERPYQGVILAIAPALRRSVWNSTHVEISLLPSDTYEIRLLRCHVGAANPITVVQVESDVHVEQLRQEVESITGLSLSLGTMGAKVARAL